MRETGAANPNLSTLERVAEARDTNAAGLIYGNGEHARPAASPVLRALACALLHAILLFFGGLVFVYILYYDEIFVLGGSGIGVSTVTDGFILLGLILLAGFMAARPFEGGK